MKSKMIFSLMNKGKKNNKCTYSKEEKKADKIEKRKNKKIKSNERVTICRFVEQWSSLMAHMGVYNKLNQTITPRNIEVKQYGFKCELCYVQGVSLSKIETDAAVRNIEEDFQCIFLTSRVSKSNKMTALFIQRPLPTPNYEPINMTPYQIFMSLNTEGVPLMADMTKYPHVFITGASNMGKTKFIDGILINLISNCTPEQLELYIFQCDKYDQIAYRRTPHCKLYAETIEEMCIASTYIYNEMLKINKSLKPHLERMECSNVIEYNEKIEKGIFKNKKKFPCRYLIIDEYATLMPDGESNKHLKECKEKIQKNMCEIIRLGRSAGFYVVIATQRGTIDMIPSFVKAMCATNITFKVNNKKSEELTGFDGAYDLAPREFICTATDFETKETSTYFGTTPNLTVDIVKSHIGEYLNRQPYVFPFSKFESYLPIIDKKKDKEIYVPNNLPPQETVVKPIQNEPIINKEVKKVKIEEINANNKVAAKENDIDTKKTKKIPKQKKGPYYDPNWKDPIQPGVKIIDETPLGVKNKKMEEAS